MQNKAMIDEPPSEPPYAYHFTNFDDFKKIVKTGRLYSRSLAEYYGAEFSHNTGLSDKVMADTDEEIKNYARLALSSANSAFYHFKNRHGKNFIGVEMRFSLEKIYSLPRLRISECGEKPASKLKFTRELPHLLYSDFLERIDGLTGNKMAELLVYGEVPLFCLSEVCLEYYSSIPDLSEIEKDLTANGTKIIIQKRGMGQ